MEAELTGPRKLMMEEAAAVVAEADLMSGILFTEFQYEVEVRETFLLLTQRLAAMDLQVYAGAAGVGQEVFLAVLREPASPELWALTLQAGAATR